MAEPDDPDAALPVDDAFPAASPEPRRLAGSRLRRGGRHGVLDATAPVHETCLKLNRIAGVSFPDRARILVCAGNAMRSILVDMVRQRRTEWHGGDVAHPTLTGDLIDALPAEEAQVLQVHEDVPEMAQVDARMAEGVEWRHSGGLTDPEIAAALGVTDRAGRRDRKQARMFLGDALTWTDRAIAGSRVHSGG